MEVTILVFGQLTDMMGNNALKLSGMRDTDAIIAELTQRYPALATAKYRIAVDKQMINNNTTLKAGSTVALLPPFSGG
jgi:molybdopterin synthase sulfur carrier subunit